jgi:hypothetical protein
MDDHEPTLIAFTKTRLCGGFVDKETKINDTHAYFRSPAPEIVQQNYILLSGESVAKVGMSLLKNKL